MTTLPDQGGPPSVEGSPVDSASPSPSSTIMRTAGQDATEVARSDATLASESPSVTLTATERHSGEGALSQQPPQVASVPAESPADHTSIAKPTLSAARESEGLRSVAIPKGNLKTTAPTGSLLPFVATPNRLLQGSLL